MNCSEQNMVHVNVHGILITSVSSWLMGVCVLQIKNACALTFNKIHLIFAFQIKQLLM